MQNYEAQPGDSLGKIAARFFGRDGRESRRKLIALNPELGDNPDLIVAGKTSASPPTTKPPPFGRLR